MFDVKTINYASHRIHDHVWYGNMSKTLLGNTGPDIWDAFSTRKSVYRALHMPDTGRVNTGPARLLLQHTEEIQMVKQAGPLSGICIRVKYIYSPCTCHIDSI
jgi:hypothetical protein